MCLHVSETINCGEHKAATCNECPQGNGANWCNGECKWNGLTSTCLPKNGEYPLQ